jgi:hypothetical protein
MKKLLFLFLALAGTTLAAQDMGSMAAAADAVTSDEMIGQLAGDQIKSLAKKFNLTDAQAEQASAVIQEVMKSPKFKEMLGKYSPDQLLAGSGTDMIQNALLGNKDFMKGMKGVVSKDQMGMMKEAAKALN